MPELPDIQIYIDELSTRLIGQKLERATLRSPFLLRTHEPPLSELIGKTVFGISRLGKRIIWELEEDLFIVFHLMLAGRFRWFDDVNAKPIGKITQALFFFPNGTLQFTEAGTKKSASLHIVRGDDSLRSMNPGGLEVFEINNHQFIDVMKKRNMTIKKAMIDPKLLSGIGNTFSDEILVHAGISPLRQTKQMDDKELIHLFETTKKVLTTWTEKLRQEFNGRFPGAKEITAFRPDYVVHGKFGKPCGICGTEVQRIRYENRETNYCPNCQTGGKILADRAMSRLLKDQYPRSIETKRSGSFPSNKTNRT